MAKKKEPEKLFDIQVTQRVEPIGNFCTEMFVVEDKWWGSDVDVVSEQTLEKMKRRGILGEIYGVIHFNHGLLAGSTEEILRDFRSLALEELKKRGLVKKTKHGILRWVGN